MPEIGERATLYRLPVPDYGDPVAQGLDLGEDVAREEHGPPAPLLFLYAPAKECRHKCHLLTVAFGVGTGLLPRVELETLQEVGAAFRIEPAPHTSDEIDYFPTHEPRPECDVSWYIGETAVQYDSVAPGVAAQKPCLPGVLADQAEQYTQRRRLARTVRPQEAVHLTTLYREVQPIQREGLPEFQ